MPSPETALLALVALTGVGALVWRSWARRARERRLEDGLQATAPKERIAALDRVAERGVTAHGEALLALARREQHAGVRAALVNLIARFQWEPVADPATAELREWAAAEVERVGIPNPTPPHPDPGAPRDDTDVTMVDRVEEALDEAVSWLKIESPQGNIVVDRPDSGSHGSR